MTTNFKEEWQRPISSSNGPKVSRAVPSRPFLGGKETNFFDKIMNLASSEFRMTQELEYARSAEVEALTNLEGLLE